MTTEAFSSPLIDYMIKSKKSCMSKKSQAYLAWIALKSVWLTGDAKNRINACDPDGVLGRLSISSLREIAPPREVYFKTLAWMDIERLTPRDKSAAIEALPVGTTFISREDMADDGVNMFF
jgi:hypothetical protein